MKNYLEQANDLQSQRIPLNHSMKTVSIDLTYWMWAESIFSHQIRSIYVVDLLIDKHRYTIIHMLIQSLYYQIINNNNRDMQI